MNDWGRRSELFSCWGSCWQEEAEPGGARLTPGQFAKLPGAMRWHYRLRVGGWTRRRFCSSQVSDGALKSQCVAPRHGDVANALRISNGRLDSLIEAAMRRARNRVAAILSGWRLRFAMDRR
jgi:hypothetical protein